MTDQWMFYTREAITQIEFAERSWTAFLDAEKGGAIFDIFLHLQHFLNHAAIVGKILNRSDDSRRQQEASIHIDLSGIDLKPFRKLRNHLEHFDERLDKWISEHGSSAFFDMNIVRGQGASLRKHSYAR